MSARRSKALRERRSRDDDDGDGEALAAPGPSPAADGQALPQPGAVGQALPPSAFGAGVRAWIAVDGCGVSGVITFQLDSLTCPDTVTNFRFLVDAHRDTAAVERRQQLLGADHPLPPPLCGSAISAIRANEMLEFGTSPSTSFWGKPFKDEWPRDTATLAQRNQREFTNAKIGTLSMANAGPNTNASRFFVTLTDGGLAELDEYHVPFGRVVDGMDILEQLNAVRTDPKRGHAPKQGRVTIVDCGIVDPLAAFKAATAAGNGGANPPNAVGGRRGRDADDVLSGRWDVARIRVSADDDGTTADDRIHSTAAMAGAHKKRRGEAQSTDPRFAGELCATAIDSSRPLAETMPKITPQQAVAAQRRVFEADLMQVTEDQRYKKGAVRLKAAKEKRVAAAFEARRAKLKAQRKAGGTTKTKYY